jgi:NADH-quinone oxidoreductase subunit J
MGHLMLAATIPDAVTFAVAAIIAVAGALGVVLSRNPVHSALMLIMTLFGVAVLFVEEDAQFLAAVQVIVYAGAIVVLFLFVIMLLGVDRSESLAAEPMPAQRWLALGLGALGLVEVILLARGSWPVGARSVAGRAEGTGRSNIAVLGKAVFTTYLLPFEITSALLVIAVIGAVVLARRPRTGAEADGAGPLVDAGEIVGGGGGTSSERAIEGERSAAQLGRQGESVGSILKEQEGVSVVQRPES